MKTQRYRKDAPLERAVVISGNHMIISIPMHIGPALDFFEKESCLTDELPIPTPGPGIWIWEGQAVSCSTYDEPYEVELVGKYRPATEAEEEAVAYDEYPWDPNDWLEETDGQKEGREDTGEEQRGT